MIPDLFGYNGDACIYPETTPVYTFKYLLIVLYFGYKLMGRTEKWVIIVYVPFLLQDEMCHL